MNKEVQIPPKGDNRYRIHRSVKCYLLEMMCGSVFCTLYISSSIERVVYISRNGTEKVQYKNRFYELQNAERMTELVAKHLLDKGGVSLSGKSLYSQNEDNSFIAYPFIDITDNDERDRYQRLRVQWLKSDDFKSQS